MAGRIVLIASICFLGYVHGGVTIIKCKEGDNACVKQTTQDFAPIFANGISEFGIEVLDPMTFKTLDASDKDLKLVLKDIVVKGLKDCKIVKVKRDVKRSKILLDLLCNPDISGTYVMSGRVLVLPMEGNGELTVNLRKLLLNIDADLITKTGKDGKPHWSIKTWKFDFDLKAKSTVYFANLYPGNELLGQAARELVKENGNDIIFAVGRPVIKTIITKVVDNVEMLFQAMPIEDLVEA